MLKWHEPREPNVKRNGYSEVWTISTACTENTESFGTLYKQPAKEEVNSSDLANAINIHIQNEFHKRGG